MSERSVFGRWYRDHLGEPPEPDHVSGYWTVLLGAGVALAALVFLLASTTYEADSGLFFLNRQIAFTLGLLAGPIVGLGVVYLLPLQQRAVTLALAGIVVCAGAIVAFNLVYPADWNHGLDYSAPILTAYAGGIALQFLTILLYPLVSEGTAQSAVGPTDGGQSDTTEVDTGNGPEDGPAIESASEPTVGSANGSVAESANDATIGADGATIATPDDDAIATPDDAAVETANDAVVESTDDAPSETADGDDELPSNGQFELYKDGSDEWRWRLRHHNGNVVADSGQGHRARSAIEEAVERVQSVAGEADTLAYDPAGFECYPDESGGWRWRLRQRNGQLMADSREGYASRGDARRGIDAVRDLVADEERFEVYDDGAYRWRLTAENGDVVAESDAEYGRRASARDAVARVRDYVPVADVLAYDPAGFEVYQDDAGEWRWRLRHRTGNVLADSGEGYTVKAKARQGMRSVRNNAAGAAIVERER